MCVFAYRGLGPLTKNITIKSLMMLSQMIQSSQRGQSPRMPKVIAIFDMIMKSIWIHNSCFNSPLFSSILFRDG